MRGMTKIAILTILLSAPAAALSQTTAATGAEYETPADGVAQDEHAAHRDAAASAEHGARAVRVQLHDLPLLTQDGERVRFRSELVADHLVAITFTYSSCTTICPIYSALFQQVQNLLGDRVGKEVVLITMTLDPTTDIPPRLQREARKYRARPGWYFLTGDKGDVDQVLRGMDAYFADFTQHPPMALVGDGRSGEFLRLNGFPEPKLLVSMLDDLAAARHEGAGHH